MMSSPLNTDSEKKCSSPSNPNDFGPISTYARRSSTLQSLKSIGSWLSTPRTTINVNEPLEEAKDKKHGNCVLASFMSKNPEVGAFERFGDLNVYNLLVMQSELCQLREDLYEAAENNDAVFVSEEQPPRQLPLDCSIKELRQSGSEQWNILLQIQKKLKAYNEALLQQVELNSKPSPTTHNLTMLQYFPDKPAGCHGMLCGPDSELWDDKDPKSFVALSGSHAERDLFSRWAGDTFLRWWHENIVLRFTRSRYTGDEEGGFTSYNDDRIASAAHIISTFLSSLLATLPMFALFAITNLKIRLGLVMTFTTIFSVTLAVFSKARRIEIFAATAAFAAVQVVFVGSVGGQDCGC